MSYPKDDFTEDEKNPKVSKERELEEKRRNDIEKIKKYLVEGKTRHEVAVIMGCSIRYIEELIRESIRYGTWFSESEIEEIPNLNQRKNKKDSKKKKVKKAIQSKKSPREIDKTKAKDREIHSYDYQYKLLRKKAKKEDDAELDGEENVSISGRKDFIDLLKELYNLGATISNEDIEIILNAIYMNTEFVNSQNISFLIKNAYRCGGLNGAEAMITELISMLSDTKYNLPLCNYKKWIKQQKLIPKIKEMKKQGFSNTQIGEELGITSTDVIVILNNENNDVDFFGDGNR